MNTIIFKEDSLRRFMLCRQIIARHYEDFWHWTEGVFSSKELAEQYIEKEKARYDSDITRIDELDELYHSDRITDAESFEFFSLKAYWSKAGQCCPRYRIEEYEMT